ncbi:MAG: 5'/3'-nucleotidase SurE [Candidatus Velthaea sp.]
MRRILVTNDDGVDSEGIIVLAEALRTIGLVTVVAPDSDRSGVSHSISTRHPVTVTEVKDRAVRTFACSGMPADCVVVGTYELCGGVRPNLVVSGINRGANLADDVNYSGTVAAAVEGILVGVPSIAVSLAASWPERDPVHHWQTAADLACEVARRTLEEPLPPDTYWNINVPNVEKLKGVHITRQGRKRYTERVAREHAGGAGAYFWVWGKNAKREGAETDDAAVRAGYGSVSPLRVDRTDEAVFTERSGWFGDADRSSSTQR